MKNNKQNILIIIKLSSIFLVVFTFFIFNNVYADALEGRQGKFDVMRAGKEGFSCRITGIASTKFLNLVLCTKTVTTRSVVAQNDESVCVFKKTKKESRTYYVRARTPFIYFYNPFEGKILVSLESKLDKYTSIPLFNQNNGWVVDSKDGDIYVGNKEVEHLFYKLALGEINLNRNGRNFSSKEEVISYLQNSDFFKKLGFSEIEKNNSLNYFIPEIKSAPEKNFYYLTILSKSAIDEISQLTIKPRPKNLERVYFAVYPTNVEVKTTGDFVFPKIQNSKYFTVKETGEMLVDNMFIFWE